MRKIWLVLGLFLTGPTLASPVLAQECVGRNLLAELSAPERAELEGLVAATPYNKGIFWSAEKDDARILLIGTYHFADPRHQETLAHFASQIDGAEALLVESGPKEQERLSREMGQNPRLLTDPDGPTLPERMEAQDWQQVADAMSARGIPTFVAAKMRPWYVAMMLGISPCMLAQAKNTGTVQGLDQLLMDRAEGQDIPIRALEPWDTVLSIFGDLTPEDEIDMLRSALPAAAHADDYAATLIDAYFSGDVWQVWEFGRIDAYRSSGMSRAEVDAQMRIAGEKLMDARNSSWIAPLEAAASEAARDHGHVVAAFGALHLPGEKGVLKLLEEDGWTIKALPSPHLAEAKP